MTQPDTNWNFAPRYSIADFFCGSGGLSLGFSRTGRFNIVFGTDVNTEAVETFAKNHSAGSMGPTVLQEDIRFLSTETLWASLEKHGVDRPGQLDCMIGGPPCEGFSQNRTLGKGSALTAGAATRVDKFIDDPRNQLFKWFVEVSAQLNPAVILIENVPDLVRHRNGATREEIIEALSKAGYVVTAQVLNAADYGVPQMRRRAFFLGQRRSDYERTGLRLSLPAPTHHPYPLTHSELDLREDWLPGDSGYWTTVREAIGDLPEPSQNDSYDHCERVYPSASMTALRRFLRSSDGCVPYNHIARALGKNGMMRVEALKAGERVTDLPESLQPKSSYHYSYSRLRWAEPARTITKFAYHVGSGMFTHPDENRAITMREAARLQTFPDDFRFYSTTIRATSALIGSAVPPLLAQAIGRQIVQYLDQLNRANLDPARRSEARSQPTDAVLKRLEKGRWGTENATHQLGLAIGRPEKDLAGESGLDPSRNDERQGSTDTHS